MNAGFTLLLTLCIGIVAGLRSQITPAVVAWAAHRGWINLHGSPLAFMQPLRSLAMRQTDHSSFPTSPPALWPGLELPPASPERRKPGYGAGGVDEPMVVGGCE
jgi:hypothetical protein